MPAYKYLLFGIFDSLLILKLIYLLIVYFSWSWHP